MNYKALDRRVKKHLLAGDHTLQIACTPGLEEATIEEFKTLGYPCEKTNDPGALRATLSLQDIWKITLLCRTASRLYLQIAQFKAEGFKDLKKKLNQTPWELYLKEETGLFLRFALHHCRLHVEDNIAKTIQRVLNEQFDTLMGRGPQIKGDKKTKEREDQTLLIRGVDDHFTLSLDLGGGALYERGYKTHTTKAPLKENVAAALIYLLKKEMKRPLNYLIDPMAGSGTFCGEAIGLSEQLLVHPQRDYPFYFTPSFRPNRLKWMITEHFKESHPSFFCESSDLDPQAIRAFKANLKSFEASQESILKSPYSISQKDFFNTPSSLKEQDIKDNRALILNPPYGLRLPLQEKDQFFKSLGRRIEKHYKGVPWGIIIPGCEAEKAFHLHWHKKYLFKNGGFPVAFLIGGLDD